MPKIICISGQARSGKDTTAIFMKHLLEDIHGYEVLIIHNADLLKFMCKTLFKWDGKKDEVGRSLLQYVGTNVVRKKDPDFWVRFIIKTLELFPDEWDYVLVPDVRFPNEITMFKEAGYEVRHIHITRSCDNGLTEEQKNHLSETALDGVEPDITIANEGDLSTLADTITNVVGAWMEDFKHGRSNA